MCASLAQGSDQVGHFYVCQPTWISIGLFAHFHL